MNATPLEESIYEYFKILNAEEQEQLLQYARTLSTSKQKGVHGSSLLQYAGIINIKELDLIQQAINQDCERITPNEW